MLIFSTYSIFTRSWTSFDVILKIITIDDVISADEVRGVVSFDSLLRSAAPDNHREPVAETSNVADNRRVVALICYSSGTTGKPKGCMQTHHSLIANGCMNK